MIDPTTLTIKQASEMLKKGEISSEGLTSACLENIEKRNKELNVYLEVFDDALSQAKQADKLIKTGKGGKLTGIPLAIKDNILITGRLCSSASKMLENYRASYDANVIKKLKNEGAVFIGRTNMDEFAMGGSTENSAYGPVRNPHDEKRVAGGSSGGSAAAVAAGMALGALGSDTGGSIREPASFCGVVGVKPSYGRVSRSGLMAMGSSLDCIGPFGKTTEDAEIIYEAIKGNDTLDGTSLSDEYGENGKGEKPEEKKLSFGVPWSLINKEGVDPAVKKNFEEAVEKIKKAGHEVKDADLPDLGLALAAYYIIMPAEASTNLARFDGMRYGLHKNGENLWEDYKLSKQAGFGLEVRRRILLGTYVLSAGYYDAYYGKALSVRNFLKSELKKAFEKFDVLMTPTAPMFPWKIGEKNDPLSVYLADIFTVTANIAGLPAISVPSGSTEVSSKHLPLGLQFMAPAGREDLMFLAGKKFEEIMKK